MTNEELTNPTPHWTRYAAGGSMLRVDCFNFYSLGTRVHPLVELKEGSLLMNEWAKLYLARAELLQFFGLFDLKTTRAPASALLLAINEVIPGDLNRLAFKDSDGNDVVLNPFWVGKIRDAAGEFESVLKAELGGWDAYYVSQKGAFSTAELIGQAEMMVTQPGRSYLNDKAIADFRQAGTCLAFNLGTAATFHVVRGCEAVIRTYYTAVVGSLPEVKQRNWGAYHRNLTKCGKADPKVLGWLKHITDEYRNPILHPDEMLSNDEAIEFINACIALISSMGKAMERIGVKNEDTRRGELRQRDQEDPLDIEAGTAETP